MRQGIVLPILDNRIHQPKRDREECLLQPVAAALHGAARARNPSRAPHRTGGAELICGNPPA
jgi:hypothetical protein